MIARTFHVRATQRVENARLMSEFYGPCPERSAEGLVSPVLRKAPLLRDLSPFGLAPDVERPGYFYEAALAAVSLWENKNLLLN